ncbi:MAG TPA: hypothetical protein VFA10_04405 [Ktedonobacteraceae bacterium]|nr:hypothetical protein [Ktedonobacteraceae bacterium]
MKSTTIDQYIIASTDAIGGGPGPAPRLTTHQCWYAIARYGGYQARRNSGPHGCKTLWKGWLYIQALLEVVHLAGRLAPD